MESRKTELWRKQLPPKKKGIKFWRRYCNALWKYSDERTVECPCIDGLFLISDKQKIRIATLPGSFRLPVFFRQDREPDWP